MKNGSLFIGRIAIEMRVKRERERSSICDVLEISIFWPSFISSRFLWLFTVFTHFVCDFCFCFSIITAYSIYLLIKSNTHPACADQIAHHLFSVDNYVFECIYIYIHIKKQTNKQQQQHNSTFFHVFAYIYKSLNTLNPIVWYRCLVRTDFHTYSYS